MISKDVLAIINSSLITSTVPDCFQQATVQLFLKKQNVDAKILMNIGPFLNYPF